MQTIYHVPGIKAARVLCLVGFIVLVLMAIWILIDVFSGIFGWGLPGMVQWVEVLNVICVALPLPFVTMTRNHISMPLIHKYLSNEQARILDIFIFILVFMFAAVFAWQTGKEAWYSLSIWEYSNVGITVYWFPAKIALALSFTLMSLVAFAQIISAVRRKVVEPVEET